jgi:carboxypeptidase Q
MNHKEGVRWAARRPGHRIGISRLGMAVMGCLFFPVMAAAQLPPEKPAPFQHLPQGTGACSPTASCADVAPVIVKEAEGASPLDENLRELTDTIGGRMTGTAAAEKALAWAEEAFRAAGVDEVHTESFEVATGWAEGETRAAVIEPAAFPLRVVSIGWSPATPGPGITAIVVDAGMGDEKGFAQAGATAKGAVVLIHKTMLETWEELDEEYFDAPAIIERAMRAGAVAIFWMSSRPNLLLYRYQYGMEGKLERMPQAVMAREDALRVARLLVHGTGVRVRFSMPNLSLGPVKSQNVVAEIHGREKPEEFVLLGAHLDSWDMGTGALDNGCNAAMVIDAARAIHATGAVPRRSIRFVLFTGEEQGMLGSWAYARAHRGELDGMAAAVIFDAGSGRATGYSLGGRKDTMEAVTALLEPTAALGPLEFTTGANIGTDNFDFLLEGVPTLVANQEPANYMLNYHASSDTLDKVNMAQLRKNEALAGITAYALADAPERIGKRETRREVEALLRETGLDQQLQRSGIWPLWQDGRRGRQP